MTNVTDLSTLSVEEIKALLAEKVDAEKAATNARNGEIVEMGSDVWNQIIASVPSKSTKSTGRVGHDVSSAAFTGEDGREYTVSVFIRDVALSDEGAARVKAEKDAAEAKEKAEKAAAAYAGVALPVTA